MKKNNPLALYRGLPTSVYFLCIARMIDNLGSFILPLITLILTQKIGLTKTQTGIYSTVFMLTQAPFLLLGGKLIDKLGSKKVIVVFNILGALFYFPCAFLKPNLVMAAFIALAANMFAVSSPAFNAIITEIAPQNGLKTAYSLNYLGYNLGYAIGPVLGGLLFNRHLHLLFLIDSFTAIAAVSLIFLFVRENKEDIDSKKEETASEFAGVSFSIFRFLVKTPVLLIFSAVFLIYNFSYAQWSFMLPLQMSDLFKTDGARLYSILIGINAFAIIALTPVLTMLTHRMTPLAVISLGGIFYLFSFLMFGFSRSVVFFVAAIVLLAVGAIMINLNSNVFIAQNAPRELMGRANSLLSIVSGAGYAVGPVIMGSVLAVLSFRSSWIIVAVLILCSSAAMFALDRFQIKRG